jgi:hypothetical protein
MTYAVFQCDRNKKAADKIKSIALMMLMQESKLKGFDIAYSDLNTRKIASNKTEVLAGYISCILTENNAVSLIKFPSNLDGDDQLMVFGDEYLGCINVDVKKSELVERIELINFSEMNGQIKNWLTVKLSNHVDSLTAIAGLNEAEIAELKEIEKKQKNPYAKWIDKREKRLKKSLQQMPSFLKREF